MKVLITGSNGYLGKAISKSLFLTGNAIGHYTRKTEVNFIQQFNPDVVVHTICSYGRNGESPNQIYQSNLNCGIEVLSECKKLDKRVTFINCGTSLKFNTNLYSISKGQFVEYGKFASSDQLQFLNMNLQHFYGPGATNNFISYVFENCFTNKDLALTEGTQQRDFIYIDDVITAFKTVIEKRNTLLEFENIDVGTGVTTQLRDVITKIKEITKSSSALEFGKVPMRENEEMIMSANTKFLNKLGWTYKNDINKGLALVKDYYGKR